MAELKKFREPAIFAAIGFFAGLALDGIELVEKAHFYISPYVVAPETQMEYLLLGSYFFEPGPGYPSGYQDYFKGRPNTKIFGSQSLYEYRSNDFAEIISQFSLVTGDISLNFPISTVDYSLFAEESREFLDRISSYVQKEYISQGAARAALAIGEMYTLSISNVSDKDISSIRVAGFKANIDDVPVSFDFPSGVHPSDFRLGQTCLEYKDSDDWNCITPPGVEWKKVEQDSLGIRRGFSLIIPMFSLLEVETLDQGQVLGQNVLVFGEVFLPTSFVISVGGREFSSQAVRPVFNTLQVTPGFDVRSGA